MIRPWRLFVIVLAGLLVGDLHAREIRAPGSFTSVNVNFSYAAIAGANTFTLSSSVAPGTVMHLMGGASGVTGLALTLPATAADGQMGCLINVTGSTMSGVTVSANTGQTLTGTPALTSMPSLSPGTTRDACYVYTLSTKVWMRVS